MSTIGTSTADSPPIGAIVDRATILAASTFAELVRTAGGRHPIELLESLKAYAGEDGGFRLHVDGLIRQAAASAVGHGHPQGKGLALPHPLDCEWRFTDGASAHLLSLALDATRAGDTILLYGMPSVAVAAALSSHDRRFAVIGENNVITSGLRSLTARDRRFTFGRPARSSAAAALLDPPWYPEYFSGMLADAASCCVVGAHVLLSCPSVEVRPSMRDDLSRIHDVAVACGLVAHSLNEGVLEYRTPLFEINAFRAAGIGAWLPFWRRSDLQVFRKERDGTFGNGVLPERSGFELTISGVRLRVLRGLGGFEGDLEPMHPGEIFPSVSMRAPRRSEAVLWTSGNRAFRADSTACLAAIASIASEEGLLPKGFYPGNSDDRKPRGIDRINMLIHKLRELVDRERAEATTLLGHSAWETTANDARFLNTSQTVSL